MTRRNPKPSVAVREFVAGHEPDAVRHARQLRELRLLHAQELRQAFEDGRRERCAKCPRSRN